MGKFVRYNQLRIGFYPFSIFVNPSKLINYIKIKRNELIVSYAIFVVFFKRSSRLSDILCNINRIFRRFIKQCLHGRGLII